MIDYRDSEGKTERLAARVAELVALKVDVIIAPGTLAALAAKRATTEGNRSSYSRRRSPRAPTWPSTKK